MNSREYLRNPHTAGEIHVYARVSCRGSPDDADAEEEAEEEADVFAKTRSASTNAPAAGGTFTATSMSSALPEFGGSYST